MVRQFGLWVVLMGLSASAYAQTPSAVWANDHARLVIQSVDGDGKLTGTYENFAGNLACSGSTFPVTGWIDGDRMTFSVRRKDPRNCTSVQAWTGYVASGELVVEYVGVGWNGKENVVLNGRDRYRKE